MRMLDLLRGLPADVRDILAAPPEHENALVELALAWPGLVDADARIARRLRLFVLSVDPLAGMGRLAPAWATANGDGDGFEVVVYVPLEHALDIAKMDGGTVAEVFAVLGESAVTVGGRCESLLASGAYPHLAAAGEAEGLLDDPVAGVPGARVGPRFGMPAVSLVSEGWEPIGLGAIQDLVQEAFGPVDLGRSGVRLRARLGSMTCPACAGRTFGFPADLEEQRASMCPPHAEEAGVVTENRLRRAAASNPYGWARMGEACERLEETPVPWTMRRRLRAVTTRSHTAWPAADGDEPAREAFVEQVRDDAELVLALAAHLRERPERFGDWLEEDDQWVIDDWLLNIPLALGQAGLIELLDEVGEALTQLSPRNAAMYASDAAVVFAEAGEADKALARVEANVRAWPDDLWVRILCGDVYARLSDPVRAEEQYRHAVDMARAGSDPSDVEDAYGRLAEFLSSQPGREADGRAAQDELREWNREHGWISVSANPPRSAEPIRPAVAPSAAQPTVRRNGPKTGRNDPCPCASGRKFKRCCGG